MLLVKLFREEKFVFAQVNYIRDTIGRQYTENPPFSLGDVFKDSNHYSPIIFVLSTGADPLAGLMRFAAEKDFSDKLEIISLGQGQGPIAEKAIAQATKNGKWICLMNCHLATSWMMPMEKLIEGFSSPTADIHTDFRLWLTSMPSTTFPVSVLQNGIKITNEPPKGVRTNMLRSLTDIGDAGWDDTTKPKYWKKLLFSLVFFHAVIQERRKYGPLGWNIRYEFNNSDLDCARLNLKMFIEDQAELPWEALLYVSGQINYGGRVTDDLDRRCLMCILNSYYLPSVVNTKDYKFSSSGTYYCPTESSLSAVLDYVRSFPITDDPELFGMHDNANISFQLQETLRIIETVLSLQPRLVTAAGGKSPEDKVDDLASEILENLPNKVLMSEACDGLFKLEPNGAYNCLDTVLMQESDRYNRVLDTMRKTLGDLRKALKGLVVMSSDLEKMFTSMVNNQVPELWSKVGWLSTKTLASWVKDLDRRLKFMREWMTAGTPKSFWLPGFFFPQGFMTGALQSHARRYKLPIDTLNFGFKILPIDNSEDVHEAPADGLYIDGLYVLFCD
jgi:dynein heavy chain